MWCLRHAESIDNVARVLSSAEPGSELTELGQAQAAAAARLLADEPIVAVYASPTVRTLRTAAAIAAPHGLDVQLRPSLIEWALGECEGRSDAEAYAQCAAVARAWIVDRDLDARIPGGDSGRELVERCVAALTEIADAHPGESVVVVSHGGALAASMMALCAGFTADTVWGRPLRHATPFLLTRQQATWQYDTWPGDAPLSRATDAGESEKSA